MIAAASITTGVVWVDGLLLWVAAIAAILGGLFTIGKSLRSLRSIARKLDRVATQLLGDDETPSLDERLGRIEHELHPNSGSSMRDAIDRTEAALAEHVEQANERLAKGAETEIELRRAIADMAAALPTIAESTPPSADRP